MFVSFERDKQVRYWGRPLQKSNQVLAWAAQAVMGSLSQRCSRNVEMRAVGMVGLGLEAFSSLVDPVVL